MTGSNIKKAGTLMKKKSKNNFQKMIAAVVCGCLTMPVVQPVLADNEFQFGIALRQRHPEINNNESFYTVEDETQQNGSTMDSQLGMTANFTLEKAFIAGSEEKGEFGLIADMQDCIVELERLSNTLMIYQYEHHMDMEGGLTKIGEQYSMATLENGQFSIRRSQLNN